MTLQAPWFLLLALLLPAALWLRRPAPTVLFSPGADGLPPTWRVRLLFLPRLLHVAGLLLVVVALARPVSRVPVPETTAGIDITLCLDTSSSMAARDLDPDRTRLDVAKDAAARFLTGRPDDRIGLIAFARYPDLRCPPTLDHRALLRILADVTLVESDGPEDATGMGTAVARAAQVLSRDTAPSKVVILLTDGEENVATRDTPDEIAPLHAGQLCRRLGVRVYAVSAGSGEKDTGELSALATRTGGRFFAARDAGALDSVYRAIDVLEKEEFQEPRFDLEEDFPLYLTAALALLLLGRLLAGTVWRTLP